MVANFSTCGTAPPAVTALLMDNTCAGVKLLAVATDIVGSSARRGNSALSDADARTDTHDPARATIRIEVLHRIYLTVVDEWLPRSAVARTTVENL